MVHFFREHGKIPFSNESYSNLVISDIMKMTVLTEGFVIISSSVGTPSIMERIFSLITELKNRTSQWGNDFLSSEYWNFLLNLVFIKSICHLHFLQFQAYKYHSCDVSGVFRNILRIYNYSLSVWFRWLIHFKRVGIAVTCSFTGLNDILSW